MFGCYRKGDAEDPETYTAAIAATLALYPLEIVLRVTDPRIGLPSYSQFLPNVAEVRDACEAVMAPARKAQDRKNQEERQRALSRARDEELKRPIPTNVAEYLAKRKSDKQQGPAASAETLLRVYTEGRARYGKTVTLSPDARAIIEAAGLEIPA